MKIQKILNYCDHTLLKVDATWDDIRQICDDGIKYQTASICIPPAFVGRCRDYINEQCKGSDFVLKVCTVIGFPNGYNTTKAKVSETIDAIENGADEVDMVINVGELKAGNYEYVLNEILAIRKASEGKILKVIIETCLLTDEEKIIMCKLVTESGADFIKTSTGFSTGGATFEDIQLFSDHIGPNVQMKAAGGISSLEDAEKFISLGATRLGTSRIVKLAKEM